MGAASGGFCHADTASAAAYHCASAFPQLQNGSVISCASASGGALTLGVSTVPSGCTGTCTPVTGTLTVTPSYVSCDPTEWLRYNPLNLGAVEGGLIAAAIAGCWFTAIAWRAVREGLNDSGERGL